MKNMHIHINISMLSCMAKCTHVHIAAAKAIYQNFAKLNILNKDAWVRESTNPIGPKKIWVLKNTPNLIDVGVSSSSKTWGEMVPW